MKKANRTGANARERILEAAGEIFAECGYQKATVRDICGKAAVNLAAINYHFGDKENLYRETLRNAVFLSYQKYPPDGGATGADRPEDRLRAYIRSFLFRILDPGRSAWFGKIISREIIEPTPVLDSLIKEVFYPNFLRLVSIIEDIVGRDKDPETVRFCAASILGQCLYFGNSKTRFFFLNKKRFAPEKIEGITDHITRFSINALAAINKT
ncbi:MAG: CerR family C-terminal domain-containing protein [Syntrophales bacterium]|nr:CerR family C-terminal domain-containing protein [Syntrophales bacterium]MDD5233128.1 CerR family C-terminal domain-containing protein [Syntrophales bacterium]